MVLYCLSLSLPFSLSLFLCMFNVSLRATLTAHYGTANYDMMRYTGV